MAKQKKKRSKKYTGSEAKLTQPEIVRITAVKRSKPSQWWQDKKRIVKPIAVVVGVIFAVVILIFEIIRAIFTA